ncbi:MAG TPA: hypothetical protein V6D03_12950, partial [Candidatus Caenarcaniphilales bacterium]
TTGSSYKLASPGSTALRRGLSAGALSALPLLLLLLPSGMEASSALLTSIGSISFISILVARLSSPKRRIDANQKACLASEQQLLGEKFALEQRVEGLQNTHQANQEQVNRLSALSCKMLDVGEDLYYKRIQKVNRAVEILNQQLSYDQQLIDQYLQTIKMIEIELDTLQAVDQLPDADGFVNLILDRLNELRLIDERNQKLRLQVEVNEEISSLNT